MAIKLYTARIGQRHKCLFDITVKSGKGPGAFLAPTWELVGGHKRHVDPDDERWQQYEPLSDEQYEAAYLDLLRARWKTDQVEIGRFFKSIQTKREIAIACYCAPGTFCHRHLAVEPLIAMGTQYGIEIEYAGEYKPEAMPREVALTVASELIEQLRPACERIEVAGSTRRGEQIVSDLELVIISKGDQWHQLTDEMREAGKFKGEFRTRDVSFKIAWGDRQRKAVYEASDGSEIKVDMYLAEPDNWGYIFFLRTGPGDQNTALMKHLNYVNAPVQFQDGYAWTGGYQLSFPEEVDFFAALGIEYIPPEQRSEVALMNAVRSLDHQWPDLNAWKIDPISRFRAITDQDLQLIRMGYEGMKRYATEHGIPLARWPGRIDHNGVKGEKGKPYKDETVFGIPGWEYHNWEEWFFHHSLITHCITVNPVPGHLLTLEDFARGEYQRRLNGIREVPETIENHIVAIALEFLLAH